MFINIYKHSNRRYYAAVPQPGPQDKRHSGVFMSGRVHFNTLKGFVDVVVGGAVMMSQTPRRDFESAFVGPSTPEFFPYREMRDAEG